MATESSFSPSDQSNIRSRLRTLRASLAQARDALMHFKDDRPDRDKLEPAARRVDDLMHMFVSNLSDRTRGLLWICEIQTGVEQVKNPKVTDVLRAAQADVSALLEMMSPDRNHPQVKVN